MSMAFKTTTTTKHRLSLLIFHTNKHPPQTALVLTHLAKYQESFTQIQLNVNWSNGNLRMSKLDQTSHNYR